MTEILPPKRKTITKVESIERARKLSEFIAKPAIKKEIDAQKEHKRASWIREKFAEETGCKIPVSSIYKLLRPKTADEPAEPEPAEPAKEIIEAAKKVLPPRRGEQQVPKKKSIKETLKKI